MTEFFNALSALILICLAVWWFGFEGPKEERELKELQQRIARPVHE